MVQFNKLKLTGFKSFVENTELRIDTGLTGVIGPNGCGKSNLVEALRWVMGENSPKRMRSSGMNDVIFAGSELRPQRNTAEVILTVDNTDRTAPAELNSDDTLEISRKIERDVGSIYKVNGKNVRMKDVQLLFADSSIGANSPAMVSQGRVADMINAKPQQRRLVLEEAAGISGLHARRHEAELKLRGAETNLTRVEDVIGNMGNQLENLKKQARQAARYRNLSGLIEQAESVVLYTRWLETTSSVERALQAFKDAEAIVVDKTMTTAALSTEQTEATAVLPELRQTEAAAAATLQRLKLAYGSLETEERKVMEERTKSEELLRQFTSDVEHEKNQKIEANETIERLTSEYERHTTNMQNQEEFEKEAKEKVANSQNQVSDLEIKLSALTETVATQEANLRSMERNINNIKNRQAQLAGRKERFESDYTSLLEKTPQKTELEALSATIDATEQKYNDINVDLEIAEMVKTAAENALNEERETLQKARDAYKSLVAESEGLRRLLQKQQSDEYEPIIDKLEVESGLEKALAVALGDDLQASLNKSAPVFWRELIGVDNLNNLPEQAQPLSKFVRGPFALKRILSQIGVVENAEMAEDLMSHLYPGQCLVTYDGGAWRWDGLVITPGAENASAIRLEHKNRLSEIEEEIEVKKAILEEAELKFAEVNEKHSEARVSLDTLRRSLKETAESLNSLRSKHSKLTHSMSEVNAKLSSLTTSIETTSQEFEEVTAEVNEAEKALAEMPDTSENKKQMEAFKEELSEKRHGLIEDQSSYNEIKRAGENRLRRMESIKVEIESWSSRMERIYGRVLELEERINQAKDIIQQLDNRPVEIEAEKQELMTSITEAEIKRQEAADILISSETKVNNLQRDLREAEHILSDAREARAMAQASVNTTQNNQQNIEGIITEKFSATPEELVKKYEIDASNLPEINQMQSKLERLLKERENMGPVNLRAEVESQEITDKMTGMETERNDLVQAIEKLREGINKLNKEARERLLASFETVDKHFQVLFTRLFNGGSAYMKMVDAADPLEAGLEIFAQPPGKKNQSLSLLSGGEQALTSIALIFAMFLTNPAPICVLDEVDAPLDESNVDRYCSLLEHLVQSCRTRFIVITHHRMTMARMDRLYGVTMGEKGVSQLVSVDLNQYELELDKAA